MRPPHGLAVPTTTACGSRCSALARGLSPDTSRSPSSCEREYAAAVDGVVREKMQSKIRQVAFPEVFIVSAPGRAVAGFRMPGCLVPLVGMGRQRMGRRPRQRPRSPTGPWHGSKVNTSCCNVDKEEALGLPGLWSGRRDLNPRRSPWQGDTLPLSYARRRRVV